MFLCQDCAMEECHWRFDLAMALSYGCCEVCEEVKPCVDISVDCMRPIAECAKPKVEVPIKQNKKVPIKAYVADIM